MLHEDYLLRLLRPFLLAMASILALKAKGDGKAALAEIDRTGQQLLGLNSTMMNKLSERYLLELLEMDTDFGALRGLVLAGLLKEEADIYRMQEREDESFPRYVKALNIYLEILFIRGKPDFRNDAERVLEIVRQLRGMELPPETRYALFRYFEHVGKYAQAEDALFELIEQQPDDPSPVRDGIAFYRRLQKIHPRKLAAGNLPIEEVQAGLRELMRLQETHFADDL